MELEHISLQPIRYRNYYLDGRYSSIIFGVKPDQAALRWLLEDQQTFHGREPAHSFQISAAFQLEDKVAEHSELRISWWEIKPQEYLPPAPFLFVGLPLLSLLHSNEASLHYARSHRLYPSQNGSKRRQEKVIDI